MGLFDFLLTPYAFAIAFVIFYVGPYLGSYRALRGIPGPLLARFSNLWLFYKTRIGKRSLSVDQAHKEYGKIVRIQPNHISIADETAIPVIYGHANGLLKSDFYNTFVVDDLYTIFNTRNRSLHSERRKVTSHVYSAKALSQLELYVKQNIELMTQKWDQFAAKSVDSYAKIDCLPWFSMLGFDIIGDLAFGKSFGMLEKGNDIMELRTNPNSPATYSSVFQAIDKRSLASTTLACVPWLEKYSTYLPDPLYRKGFEGVDQVLNIGIARIQQRMEGKFNTDRSDILALLLQGRNKTGPELSHTDLIAEALVFLFAGADTVSNTACTILYYCLRTEHVLSKLQAELDTALSDVTVVPNYEQVKSLPYLHNVINEGMRIYPTVSLGLPREVPPGLGIHVLGQHFPAGTVLSVSAYTVHHSAEIWGVDVEEFKPERWERLTDSQKTAFIPFSFGPRSCMGRNQAMMELALMIATIVRRWDFKVFTENLESVEGFLTKPTECIIGIKKRT